MKTTAIQQKPTQGQALLSLCFYFGALLALFLMSHFAFAGDSQNLGDVAKNVTETMTNVAKLISAASYVAGVGFALMGMMKFKAHKDNPAQVPLSQPIVLLCIAAGLVFLPSIIETGGSTIFGSSGKQADTQGGGLDGASG